VFWGDVVAVVGMQYVPLVLLRQELKVRNVLVFVYAWFIFLMFLDLFFYKRRKKTGPKAGCWMGGR
jgi:hypothetical protein